MFKFKLIVFKLYSLLLISFKLNKTVLLDDLHQLLNKKKDVTISCDVPVFQNIWDIFAYHKIQLKADFNHFSLNNNYSYHRSLIMINQDNIYIGNNVKIKAVVISFLFFRAIEIAK